MTTGSAYARSLRHPRTSAPPFGIADSLARRLFARIVGAWAIRRMTSDSRAGADIGATVSLDGLVYLLRETAATMLPVVAIPRGGAEQYGPITDVLLRSDLLCVRGPTVNMPISIRRIAHIGLDAPRLDTPAWLMIRDGGGRCLARIGTDPDHGLAWAALVGWLQQWERRAPVD